MEGVLHHYAGPLTLQHLANAAKSLHYSHAKLDTCLCKGPLSITTCPWRCFGEGPGKGMDVLHSRTHLRSHQLSCPLPLRLQEVRISLATLEVTLCKMTLPIATSVQWHSFGDDSWTAQM
eukprot:scaffold279862_cov20-Tisochrysis_lutea.AAC.1